MNFCPCGKEAAEGSPLCPRCCALQVLELNPSAAPSDIRLAYHMLVKVWHPDRFQSDPSLKQAADEKLKAINSAYVFLTSNGARSAPPRRPAPPPREPSSASAPPPARSGIFSLRNGLAVFGGFSILQRLAVLAIGLGGSAIFLKVMDTTLSSDPATAHIYLDYRSALVQQIDGPRHRLWAGIENALHRFSHPSESPLAAALPSTASADDQPYKAAARSAQPSKKRIVLTKVQPIITIGLTKDEVIANAGAPTYASDGKLVFGASEVYLKDGSVVGWNIDPASRLHVKLWPTSNVDRTLRVFSVDSTKDDVLVVQGTPTLLSQDKFGYGSSEVYFRNNRVVSWKNDPASIPLRAVSR